PKDHLVAMALELPIDQSRELAKSLSRYRAVGPYDFRIDPGNTYDVDVYSHFHQRHFNEWGDHISDLFKVLVAISVGKLEELRGYVNAASGYMPADGERICRRLCTTVDAEAKKYLPRHHDEFKSMRSFYYLYVPEISEAFAEPPSPEDAERALQGFEAVFRRRDLMKDKVRMRLFEMPDSFKDRPEPIQFMLARYFMMQGPGKQQDLLQDMRGVGKDQALVELLKRTSQYKLAQVVSTLPEVPPDIRAEAAQAQDKVPPSDIQEVTSFLQVQLREGSDKDAILKNLGKIKGPRRKRRALGSGSIGDVYWSKLADGTEVAVKVITPTKERNFRAQVEHYKEIQYLLELYFDKYPWARRVHRWMDVFFEMTERELNLSREAATMNAVSAILPEGVAVPEVKSGLLRAGANKVLVMGFAKGEKIGDLEDAGQRGDIIEKTRDAFMGLVTGPGTFTSDIHPGNIRYNSDQDTVWLLDWGQIGQLNQGERTQVVEFVQAAVMRESESMVSILRNIGNEYRNVDQEEFVRSIEGVFESHTADLDDVSTLVEALFGAANDNGLLIIPPFLILLKGLFTFENMARTIV
ncbi:MAG: AarF/ABC1/UbiB kinase family protein, partial [Deltaproteobacteria bacterium]|nr:AarF/ABC1/UbiB kinase family protein [Deltaproteobacteria bacterium]